MSEDYQIQIRTSAGRTEAIEIKVGLHQEPALSPPLFIIIMNVVSMRALKRYTMGYVICWWLVALWQ